MTGLHAILSQAFTMIDWVASHLVLAGTGVVAVFAVVAGVHALLFKDEVRAAIGWVRLILLVPLFGSVLYYLIGINRIRRRAVALRRQNEGNADGPLPAAGLVPGDVAAIPGATDQAVELARLVGNVTSRPLLDGNLVQLLVNGDEAYPAMLEAMRRGEHRSAHLYLRQRLGGPPVSRSTHGCDPSWGRSPRPHRFGRLALLASSSLAASEAKRCSRRVVSSHVLDAATIVQLAQPPQSHGRRWSYRLHRRDEHP